MRAMIALLLIGTMLAAPTSAQQPAERIDGPAVKVGDVWMYNKINGWTDVLEDISVNTVKSIDVGGIVMESTALDGTHPSRIERTRDFNLVRIEAPGFLQTTLPFYPNYSFPLWVGKTWENKVDFFSSKEPTNRVGATLSGRVVGWESVTVPAGNFMALKIELRGVYNGDIIGIPWALSGTIEDTLWYAPEVRNAVRYEYRDTNGITGWNREVHELVRYWLKP